MGVGVSAMPVSIVNGQWVIGRGGVGGIGATWSIYPATGWVGVVPSSCIDSVDAESALATLRSDRHRGLADDTNAQAAPWATLHTAGRRWRTSSRARAAGLAVGP